METRTLSIFECKPGMKIAQTIHNDFGAVMIVENTILDRQILDRLESMDVLDVKIVVENKEQVRKNYNDNVESKYSQNVQDVKEIMEELGKGLPLDMTRVEAVMDTIKSGIYSNGRVMGPLSLQKDIKNYIYSHSINVSFMAMTLGKWMKCSEETIKHLIQAGLLHDIGKAKISDDILNKPGQLTDKEFAKIKQHPRYSYDYLKGIDQIHIDVLLGILTHHEREDGTGYPIGVTSEKINLVGKILAVIDIYDAMTSERYYRKAQTPFEVFELMQNGSFGKLHPVILNKFIRNMSEYFKGSTVALSNGDQGEVIFINYKQISKPIVKVGEEFIDLSLKPKLKISEIIDNNGKSI